MSCTLAAHAALADDGGKIAILVGGIAKLIYLPARLTQELGYFKAEDPSVDEAPNRTHALGVFRPFEHGIRESGVKDCTVYDDASGRLASTCMCGHPLGMPITEFRRGSSEEAMLTRITLTLSVVAAGLCAAAGAYT